MRMKSKTVVVIPIINEAKNIEILIPEILSFQEGIDILFVDGGSSDKPEDVIRPYLKSGKISIVKHIGAGKRRHAVNFGFKWLIKHHQYWETLIEMDGDLSHDPNEIIKISDSAIDSDLIVGSRYLKNKSTKFNSKYRKIISLFLNRVFCTRLLKEYTDVTGGFRAYSRKAVEAVLEHNYYKPGFCGNIEVLHNLKRRTDIDIVEVPITFHPRQYGKSKASYSEILYAITLMFQFQRV